MKNRYLVPRILCSEQDHAAELAEKASPIKLKGGNSQ